MGGWMIAFAILLFIISAILLICEVFIPSGGIISIASLACLIGGLYIFFQHSIFAGWIGIAIALVMIPTVLIFAYRIFPKSPFGKRMILKQPPSRQGDAIPDSEQLENMLGSEGLVVTPLRPVGMCDFNGRKLECVAEGGFVEKDKKVKVIKVEQTQLTVRIIDQD